MLQIYSTRDLGPTLQASFNPLRFVSGLLLTTYLVKEPMTGTFRWIGLGILILTLAVYFRRQLQS